MEAFYSALIVMKLSSGRLIKSLITRDSHNARDRSRINITRKRRERRKKNLHPLFIFHLSSTRPLCQIILVSRYIRVWLADFDIKCERANSRARHSHSSTLISPSLPPDSDIFFPFWATSIFAYINWKQLENYILLRPALCVSNTAPAWNLISTVRVPREV